MKKYFWIITCCVAALDQAIKAGIRKMPVHTVFYEIPGVFALTHSVNTGAAFSLFSGRPILLAVVSAVTGAAWMSFACLLGGGIGNLFDRVFFSGVTDYIVLQFVDFPIFNLADMAITGSVGVLLLLLLTNTLEKDSEGGHESDY